jgi:hypothetical protein
MKSILFFLGLAILTTGCSPFAGAPQFSGEIQPEFERQKVDVEVIWTPTEVIRAEIEKRFDGSGLQLADQGKWYGAAYPYEDRCYIFAARPDGPNDWVRFAVLGHELAHCFWGDWHEGGHIPPSDEEQIQTMLQEKNPFLKEAFDRAMNGKL